MAISFKNKTKNSTENRNSRYVQGGTTDVYSNRIGWWEKRKFKKSYNDIRFTISKNEAGRPDLISYLAYGKPIYAWLVLQYNNIVDIEEELVEGKEIVLPSEERLILSIMNNPTGGNKVNR